MIKFYYKDFVNFVNDHPFIYTAIMCAMGYGAAKLIVFVCK